jgi:hypothetical protein
VLYGRRLQLWIALALAAAVPEALVRSPDQQLAFQAFLVVQLLGVIVAAIAIAAMVSVLGLAVVRVLTWPIANRTSTFVAWSFLRAPRQVLPWPLRLWRALRDSVDATPPLAMDAAAQARFGWQGKRLGVGLLALGCGALVPWALVAGAADTATHWPLLVRNVAAATALHGLLLIVAALPGRKVRSVLVSLLALVALSVGVVMSRHPVVLPYAEPLALAAGLLVLWLVAAVRQPATEVGLAQRLARRGMWLLPAAAVVGVAALLIPAQASLLAPLAAALLLGGLYLVLQGQSKVSLPVFVSIVGVAAGTWALIVVLSVMGGFAGDLRAKMLVANAHALVESSARGQPFAEAAALAHRLRQLPGVAAASPQVRGDAIVSSAFNVNNFVSLRGIDPDLAEVQRELGATLLTGSLGLLGRPTAMGQDRALTWRRSDLPGDIPATPTDTSAPNEPAPPASPGGDAAAEDALKALQALPPGPQDPAPPQPDPRPVYVLPSGLPPRLPPTGRPPSATAEPPAGASDLAEPPAGASDAAELPDLAADPAAPVDTLANPLDDPDVQALLGDKGDEPTSVLSDPDIPISPGILLGVELARSLQVGLGDKVEVVTPDGDIGPTGLRPRIRTFRVAGVFETGLYEADSKVAYLALTEAARYFNLAGQANVLELRLTEPKEPDAVMAQIRQILQELVPAAKSVGTNPTTAMAWRSQTGVSSIGRCFRLWLLSAW